MEELEKSLAEAMENNNGPYLENDADADSALHKIQRLNQGINYVRKIAEQQIQKIVAWRDEQIANRQEAITSEQNLLQLYAEERLKNSKRKSVSLPSGKFGYRKQPPKITHDDTILLAFAKETAPQFVKVKESVDWANLKKGCTVDGDHLISQDGEIIPGVTVEQHPDKFYTEVG
ncbi:host-nuclease inhibitor Gam family protein [uncultured Acidaminococcus sp.]|uniref:host-nuclease inhibitor Gam family protein n=1 Tax=uncultured Acidaminococcus sp. TaxID=352152 RepID=UPI00294214A5|nr:host-nuclease inhibitor Gam family protein [uncultured Acidaminococcus sp.]